MGIGLYADIKLNGVEYARVALTQFNTALGETETRTKRVREQHELTAAALLKVWVAYQYVTSASSIASAVMSVFTNAVGYLINTILAPFLPLLIGIGLELFKFGAWFSEQGPTVRAALLVLGAAILFAFGGPTATAIGIVLLLLAGLYVWSSTKAALITGVIFGLAAAFFAAAAAIAFATGAAAPWLAVLLAITFAVAALILLARAAWLAIKGEGFSMPSLADIKSSIGLDVITNGMSQPPPVPTMPTSGPGQTYNNSTQNWNVNIGGSGGGTNAGRDAAIAFNTHMSARERMF